MGKAGCSAGGEVSVPAAQPHGHHVLAQAGACPGVRHPTRRFGAAHFHHGLSLLMRVASMCSLPSAEDLVVEEV